MGRFKKLNHTIYKCKFYVTWIPEYRYRVITGELQKFVGNLTAWPCGAEKDLFITRRIHLDLNAIKKCTWCKDNSYVRTAPLEKSKFLSAIRHLHYRLQFRIF